MSRRLVNSVYSKLSLTQKEEWYSRYAKVFREGIAVSSPGEWYVNFAGKRIVLPVGGPEMWLEWDAALSILGHEVEIRRAYLALLRSVYAPTTFFDVGANYGLHSLLFLAHGIRTVSFEPNETCHDYFQRVAQLNRFTCDVRPLAVGDESGFVDLWFPSTNTWFGTTTPTTVDKVPSDVPLEKLSVRQTTLDEFLQTTSVKPDLIKIDTEGAEPGILRGAIQTLTNLRPIVIFESWPGQGRDEMFSLFAAQHYSISTLRGTRSAPRLIDDVELFARLPNVNFLAVPTESAMGEKGVFRLL